jgi:parallel beta-helix repeat protein
MDFGGFEVQGRNIIVRNNLVEWCGALAGSGTNCTNIVVENNVFRYNNYRRFNPGWHSGGVKFTATRDSVFRNNLVHDNWGFGIWLDIDVNNVMVENNIVMNQPHAAGICYEISFNGHVRQNLVINCNRGIWVYSAMGTVVEENLFYDCWQGIVVHGERRKRSVRNYGHPDILVPEQSSYETRDNKVLRNWVLNSRYTDIAIGADDPEQGRANNTAEGNIIWRSTGQFASGGWDGDYRSFDAWQEAGYDRRGRYGNPGIEGIDYQHLKTWLENRIKETVGPTDACDWF